MLTTSIGNVMTTPLTGGINPVSNGTLPEDNRPVSKTDKESMEQSLPFSEELASEEALFSAALTDGSVGLKSSEARDSTDSKQGLATALEDFSVEKKDENKPGKKPGFESTPAECETCKNRKYQDGSDEMVSFKSAAHISPEAAGSAVRAHEGEHVSNAYKRAAEGDGKVLRASVSIHTAICPECGRTYVSGGETNTQIKYSDESNPYQQDAKNSDASVLAGANADFSV